MSILSLHKDLKIETVSYTAKNYYKKFHTKSINYINRLDTSINITRELIPDNPTHRLKTLCSRDLLNPDLYRLIK